MVRSSVLDMLFEETMRNVRFALLYEVFLKNQGGIGIHCFQINFFFLLRDTGNLR